MAAGRGLGWWNVEVVNGKAMMQVTFTAESQALNVIAGLQRTFPIVGLRIELYEPDGALSRRWFYPFSEWRELHTGDSSTAA